MNTPQPDPAPSRPAHARFATDRRLHVGFGVEDLEPAVAFFTALLGEGPSKRREGYAKFTPADPSVNLSLNQVTANPGADAHPARNAADHYGIEVKSSCEIDTAERRLSKAGIKTRRQQGEACCYALQDKLWATAPNGDAWEIFHVVEDAERRADSQQRCCVGPEAEETSADAAPSCCDS